MLKKEDVEMYLSLHNSMEEKLSEIIGLHGDIADLYYSTNDCEADENGISCNVEYYKWQNTNWSNIYVPKELLYNKEKFKELQEQAILAKQKRKAAEEEKKQKELERELENARELLAKYSDKSK